MEQLLAIMPLSEEQRSTVRNMGVNIVTADDIARKQVAPDDITIMYGWNAEISLPVLKAPHSHLKWIQTFSAGVDYLPLSEIAQHHIVVTNASGIHGPAIAQAILGYIFYFTRGLWTAEQRRPQHFWEQSADDLLVADETSAIIFSTGHIAVETARLLHQMNVHVAGVNRTGHPADNFDETYAIDDYQKGLAKADIIINVMPGTPATTGFFNQQFFDQLDHKLLFINVGRGSSVVNEALLNAIKQGRVKYAALDVVDPEPLPKDSPLWANDHILLTPHVSGVVDHLDTRLFPILYDNLKTFVSTGLVSRNQVDLSAGY
ncbi:MAG: phosphoglycerate dehydrogenase [Furfurilactobacillus sp.]|jgi:phosphoglycerate dehydrogenase-like enzyme|uniref:Phosphoglycerate dehydrogenase n=1 Tax=Furfurilactobacillus milii TaxID=2888272 RepID=A0ABT6D9B9_9LACO|nr:MULTISPECIES: NAD(P)-dependent oxidoreductase [Furfurilactobacillus]QLE66095.1 D-3-phosphoglycerate dehydrogenase [Furfurilactobacillus rossiae]MCF6160806.1 phosphoglycerate dehydrogenase [Furfurilactobacillus milii]MCF6163000.1 phosphoglycerate dehydrogenase [Furfurilactobacillus milii]MCF6419709.1 phosphoglycerate dehydrogenase [Furfurilactobacillus milii]MCH4012613.1 phosphoglycerate dehydrogenase [Furfurilactobacillus sp.]